MNPPPERAARHAQPAPAATGNRPVGLPGRPTSTGKGATGSRRNTRRAAKPAHEAESQPKRPSPPLEVTVEIGAIEIVEHAPNRTAGAGTVPVSLGDYLRSRSGSGR